MICVFCKVLAHQHASLHESSKKNVPLLANEMYAAGRISSAVPQSPSFHNT